jgi:hypothetical protein
MGLLTFGSEQRLTTVGPKSKSHPAGRLLLPAEDLFFFRRGALQVSNGKKPMGQLTRVAGTLVDQAKKHFQSPT